MKILVVGHAYLAPINRQKWDAYARVFPSDYVTVVTPSFWSDALFDVAPPESEANGLGVVYMHLDVTHGGNEVLHRYAWRDVWRIVRDVNPDILLVEQGVSAFSYFQWILVLLLQFKATPRLFFTWVNWRHHWGWKFKWFWWPIEWFNTFFSSAAIVGNPDAEKLLREDGFSQPILVSPQLGVASAALSLNKKKRIGFVGRLTPEKGVAVLLRAFTRLHINHAEWELWLVGSGPQQRILQQEAEAFWVEQRVVFTGSVNHERALELIETFEILVLPSCDVPSWREQFGHVLIEAMAVGVVVVGADAGAIPWVIGDAGLIFRQNCIDDLCTVLSRLLINDAERVLLAKRGHARVEKLYTHESIAKKIGSFLHDVYAQKKAAVKD